MGNATCLVICQNPKNTPAKTLRSSLTSASHPPIHPSDEEWNFQAAQELGLLKRSALTLPSWDHTGEDPLEVSGTPNMGWRGTESLKRNSRSLGVHPVEIGHLMPI